MNPSISARGQVAPELAPEDRHPWAIEWLTGAPPRTVWAATWANPDFTWRIVR